MDDFSKKMEDILGRVISLGVVKIGVHTKNFGTSKTSHGNGGSHLHCQAASIHCYGANNWLLIMGIARHLLKSEKGKEKVEDNSTDGDEGDDNVSLSQLPSSSRPLTLWPATMDEIDELVNLQ
ncbi:hypothetical protein Fot_19562 [Forsythia ovata]|uniref:Uncharacterized protein n=1 Tax=Forsythia ovata TaxID=205694 RepID=A0ABD1VLE1_9LAMI